jgi:Uri superfamily endonuclease
VRVAKCKQGMWTPTSFEPRPGTYALLLSSAADGVIRVGRLGDLRLQPGFYVYVGSALGPGGVRARLAHHMRLAEMKATSVPLAGFGSSDCDCETHLFFFKRHPAKAGFERRGVGKNRTHPWLNASLSGGHRGTNDASAKWMLSNSGRVQAAEVTHQAPSPIGHTSGREGLGGG